MNENGASSPKRRRRMRRVLSIGAIIVLALLVVIGVFGPSVAGAVAPGVMASMIERTMGPDAEAHVKGVKLAWLAPLRIESLEVMDESQGVDANLTLEKSGGLIGLALGRAALGEVTIGGSLELEIGEPAIEDDEAEAAQGAQATPAAQRGPVRVPKRLQAGVIFDDLHVSVGPMDRKGWTERVVDLRLNGQVDIAPGGVVKGNVSAACDDEALALDVDVRDLWGADGALQAERGTGTANMQGAIASRTFNRLSNLLDLDLAAADAALNVQMKATGADDASRLTINIGEKAQTPVWAALELTLTGSELDLVSAGSFGAIWSAKTLGETLSNFDAIVDLESDVMFEADAQAMKLDFDATGYDIVRVAMIDAQTTPMKASVSYLDGRAEVVELAPMTWQIIANGADVQRTLRAGTDATINGDSAGAIELALTLPPPAAGDAPPTSFAQASGSLTASKVSSELLRPLLTRAGVNAQELLGKSMDFSMAIEDASNGAAGGDEPRLVMVKLTSSNLRGEAPFDLTEDALTLREPATFSAPKSQGLASIPETLGEYRKLSTGKTSLVIDSLSLPMSDWAPSLSGASGSASLTIEGLEFVDRLGAELDPLVIRGRLMAGVTLSADAPLEAHLRIEGSDQPDPLLVDFACSFQQGAPGSDRARSPLHAELLVEHVSTRLLVGGEDTEFLENLLVEAIGETFSLKSVADGSGDGSLIRAPCEVTSPTSTGKVTMEWSPGRRLAASDILLNVPARPLMLQAILQKAFPDSEPLASLNSAVPAEIRCSLLEWTYDSKGELVMSPCVVTAGTQDMMAFEDIEVPGVGKSNILIGDSRVKIAYDPGGAPLAKIEYSARIGSRQIGDQPFGSVAVTGAGGPDGGELTYELHLKDVAEAVQRFEDPEAIVAAFGETLDVTGTATIRPSDQAFAFVIASPRLNGHADVGVRDGRIGVRKQSELTWRVGERFANRVITKYRPTLSKRLRIDGDTDLEIKASRFQFGAEGTTRNRDEELIDETLAIHGADMSGPEGWKRTLERMSLAIKEDNAVHGIRMDGDMDFGGADALRIEAQVLDLVNAQDVWTPSASSAKIMVDGEVPGVLLDGAANAGGYIAEAVGPWATVDLDFDIPREGSAPAHVKLESDRAMATLTGAIEGGVFTASEEARIEQRIMTPELGRMLFGVFFPLVTNVEKTESEKPAVFTANGLTLDLRGDVTKLNGEVEIDLGVVRFETQDFFGKLLKASGNNSRGELLQNWPSFKAQVKKGVISYKRVNLPVGDFTLGTSGTVDLPQGKVDLITYVPFSALAADVGKSIAKIPGMGGLANIPLRTRGPYSDLKTDVALDKIPGEVLTTPGRLLDQIFKDLTGSGKQRIKSDDANPKSEPTNTELTDGSDDPSGS